MSLSWRRIFFLPLLFVLIFKEACYEFRHRHDLPPYLLGKRLQIPGDLFPDQSGNQPAESRRFEPVEQGQGHGDGYAIQRMARLEAIGERQSGAVHDEGIGKPCLGNIGCLMAHQVFAGKIKTTRILLLRLPAPFFECGAVADSLRNDPIVKGEDFLLVHQHVLPPRLVFQRRDFSDQLAVVLEKWGMGDIVAGDQRGAYEDLPCFPGIDRAVIYPPLRHYRQAIERNPLEGRHLCRILFPVGIEIMFPAKPPACLFHP